MEMEMEREAAIAAVTTDSNALETVSEELQNDKEVVMVAVRHGGYSLEWASEELQNDKEVVMAAVTEHGLALGWASEELQNEKEVVLAAVMQDGWALRWASKEMRIDKEVVLAAVTQRGRAINLTSKDLQNDVEVVQAAFMQYLIQRYNTNTNGEDSSVNLHVGSLICKLVSKQVLVPLSVIHIASTYRLHWKHGMSTLIEQDYSVLESKNEATGLLPFMTFASSNSSSSESHNLTDLDTLFEMMKKHPQAVRFYNTIYDNHNQR